ncbi:MAG: amidohydrolase family protein [Calothrix sp. SM1_5_4]|nr:amidohydrolase family protein [Calothrix sp. SM1_5_4]
MLRDGQGRPTGVVLDQACDPVRALLPPVSAFELRRHLLKGVQIFNEAGFTHIRDMTCDEAQWNEAVRLDQSGLLTLAVEEYFWLKGIDELSGALDLARKARAAQTRNLRVKGVKLFLDGALGSEGAWLSKCYHGRTHQGLVLWEDSAMKEVFLRAWEGGFDVAVHAIGDEAADRVVALARGLSAKAGPEPCIWSMES